MARHGQRPPRISQCTGQTLVNDDKTAPTNSTATATNSINSNDGGLERTWEELLQRQLLQLALLLWCWFDYACRLWKAQVVAAGGLLVIGTSVQDNARVERQLRGRAGRQVRAVMLYCVVLYCVVVLCAVLYCVVLCVCVCVRATPPPHTHCSPYVQSLLLHCTPPTTPWATTPPITPTHHPHPKTHPPPSQQGEPGSSCVVIDLQDPRMQPIPPLLLGLDASTPPDQDTIIAGVDVGAVLMGSGVGMRQVAEREQRAALSEMDQVCGVGVQVQGKRA